MAGSYHHLRAQDGTFRFDLIENLRDAAGACAQLFYLIDRLTDGGDLARIAPLLEEYYGFCRGDPVPDPAAQAAWARLHGQGY